VNDVQDDDVFPHLHTGPFDLDSVDSLSDIGSISPRRRNCTNGSPSGTKIGVKFRRIMVKNKNPHFHNVVGRKCLSPISLVRLLCCVGREEECVLSSSITGLLIV
jgi:hypothetical protein